MKPRFYLEMMAGLLRRQAVVIPLVAVAHAGHATTFDVFAYSEMPVDVPGQDLRIDRLRPFNSIGFKSAPVINASGDTAFWAKLEQNPSGASFGDSIWSFSNGVMTPLAYAGMTVPGVTGGTYDTNLSRRVVIDNQGNVAYGSQIDIPGDTIRGLHVGDPAGSRTVVYEGQAFTSVTPPIPAGYEFLSIGSGLNFLAPFNGDEFVMNGNRAAFGGRLTDSTGAGADLFPELFVERDAGLTLMTPGNFFPSSQVGAVTPTGEAMFRTSINPGEGPIFSAIVSFTGDVSITAQSGSDAGGDITFTNFSSRPGFNLAGNAVFSATFSDLPASDTGIFKSTDPNGIVATEGIVAAGTPDLSGDGVPDFQFVNFSGKTPLINANGKVVFKHTARTPDNSLSVTGLWSDRSGPLTALDPVAFQGDQAVGLPEGTLWTQIAFNGVDQHVVINANNDIAFLAQAQAPGGPILTGLWAEFNGVLELVAVTGQTVNLPDGSSFEISTLDFMGGSGNQDGRPSGFSDNGQITFRADGLGTISSAYITATLGVNLTGDYNGDGRVDQGDLDFVLLHWGLDTFTNGVPTGWVSSPPNGVIGQEELDGVLLNWGATSAALTGDYNDDGGVDQGDLDLVLLNWGDDASVTGVPAGWVNSQPTGLIGQTELDGVLLNWGNTAEPDVRGIDLPEPGGLVLLGLGGLVFTRLRA